MTMFKTIADKNGGVQVLMTADEEAAHLAEQAANAAALPRLTLLAQIAALEQTQTSRRLRERALDPTDSFLSTLDSQIRALRAKL